jgi:hypothetical protein
MDLVVFQYLYGGFDAVRILHYLLSHGVISTLMRLQQKAIIIHDKLFIIANLVGKENVTVSKNFHDECHFTKSLK